jgi:hypothetical protein
MAEQSAFLTAFDEMQKKKGGFNAPAPLESVVDTVGQAPEVQSPFSQQAAAATNPLAAPIDLSAARQAPMLGGFEVKGAGAERFALGTPEVPETLFSKEYTDPNGNTAAIARIEDERARANAVDPQVSVETPEEFTPTGGAGFLPASSVPVPRDTPDGATFMGDASTALGKLSAPFTAHSQAAGGFKPEQPATVTTSEEVAASPAEVTPAGATPAVAAPVMDGSQMPQAGEEGFKFAERGSPQDYFLSNTNGGTTALSPEQITRGQEYAKQQGLNFDPTTGFSQSEEAPQVQAPQGLTTAGGQPLAEFLAGGQQKDAQGRMIDPNVDRSSFEQKSADREARQAARPDFGEAQERAAGTITDAERRGNGAPTALFKEEAEAAGLSGRAKSDFISEKTRLWSEAKEDRGIDQASGQAAGERANLEMGLKIKDWEKTNADERKERVDEMNTEIGALTSIIGQAENISGVAQEAGRQVGAGTTGFFSPLKFIGGTTAADLAGNLETIKSDAFVANITEMRKNSPTGGAVGNVSDKDLEMLQSLQTSFRQNLKPTTLRANLRKYQKIRAKVVTDAKKGFVLKYGQENLNKYFGDQQQTAGKGSSAIPNDRNVTTSNNELYEKHSQ